MFAAYRSYQICPLPSSVPPIKSQRLTLILFLIGLGIYYGCENDSGITTVVQIGGKGE